MSEIKWKTAAHSGGVHIAENDSCVSAVVLPNPVGGLTAQAYGGAIECSSIDTGDNLEDAKRLAVKLAKEHAAKSVEVLTERIEKIRKAWGV